MLLPGPIICHRPPYRLLMLLPGSRVSHGSLYGLPIAAVSIATLCMCHFRSPHTAGGFHLVIGCCMASPLLLPPPATLWLHTRGFGPVTAQMSEVCG
ncbi:unnamed protein product [Staurois parvus]|uniref:Uncharacterized protein n=1 Tax=Staurois parvus TaxID=386267 RepID=A0ABN9FI05_9NEOB|nr:unnamed protein product [Staurois parvus]